MDLKMKLDSIQSIINNMPKESFDARLKSVERIKKIVDELRFFADEQLIWSSYMSEKFKSLMWSVEAIAGLNDGNRHSKEQHASWARIAIKSLESFHCFNIN